MRVEKTIVSSCLVIFLGLCAVTSWSQQPESEGQVEFDLLQEILLEARPAPALGRFYRAEESDVPERHKRVVLDLTTGETTVILPERSGPSDATVRPGQKAVLPWPAGGGPPVTPWAPEQRVEGGDSMDGDIRSCTPPPRSLASHEFPWNTTYKLMMRFNVSGTDYYTVCSASSFGSFHLLTAGHCIYSHDPNGDGNTSDAKWADEIWAWAAQTDVVNPFGSADHPYGFAKVTILDTYYGWIDNADWNFDVAYVALDRRVGDRTGWMGREANLTTSTLNFNGYPAETPYVPAGELAQYPHSDIGNVTGYTTDRIQLCAYTYGGHSGGPVWRYDPGTGGRFVQGVNSTSNRVGYAEATRLTTERLGHMDARITNDSINVPPVPRPDLTEFVFSYADDTKDLSPNSVLQDHTFFVKYSLINAGFANTGPITVDFYLSNNGVISSYDTLVGTATLGAIDGSWFYIVPDMPLVAAVNPGTYWAGWIMRCDVPEYGGDFTCTNDPCGNVVIVADETLTVLDCSDGWEPDDVWSSASFYSQGVPQNHGICPIGDQDWLSFTLGQPSSVVLETSASSGDTEIWLYNSGLGLIEYDNNDGSGVLSRIDRQCGAGQLSAGTYYVKVGEYGNDQVIDTYTIGVYVSSCNGAIFFDGFESGNTTGWSSVVP